MKKPLINYWSVCISTLMVLLSTNFSIAAPESLYTKSMVAFEKYAASAQTDDWRFVFLGDNRANDRIFKEALRRAASFNPLFILHGGDLAEDGTADEYAHFLKVLKEIPDLPPIFIVRGNHERHNSLFEEIIGPLDFTIDNKRLGFRLVAVDNAHYALERKELDYLSRMLDQSRPVQVVSMHIPPKTDRWKEHSFHTGKVELLSLMTGRKVKLGLFSHIHMYDMAEINGIPSVISGGTGADLTTYGTPGDPVFHIVVVEVKKGKVSYKVVRF